MKTPFFVDPYLTSIAVGYRNELMIADSVLPRVLVSKEEFRYWKYEKADKFTVPDTKVGRKSKVHEIEFGATEDTSKTEDFGLDDPIPMADIANAAGQAFDPLASATENIADLLALAREQRVAALVFASGSYVAGQTTDLSEVWSDHTASDPVADILEACDKVLMRPNVATMGRVVYTALRQHPKVIAAAFPLGGNAVTGGMASKQALQDLFELDEILVGEGWVNSGKRGQTPTMARVWGNHLSLFRRDGQANPGTGRATFGFTAQFGDRVAGQEFDSTIGLRGGIRLRVGESVKELIIATDFGYLFQNCVAATGVIGS
jgi:hypothetical protein